MYYLLKSMENLIILGMRSRGEPTVTSVNIGIGTGILMKVTGSSFKLTKEWVKNVL